MTTKTKNSRKNVANARRTRDERATNAMLFVPIMENLRGYLRKDVANAPQIWLPIETNLIFRYEFAACSIQTRYIFVAILLYCGQRGTDEIPADKRFLASALNADARTIEKAVQELENFGLLVERKKDREEKKDTDRQKEGAGARVSVNDLNLSENGSKNEEEKSVDKKSSATQLSEFSLDECKSYVEKEVGSGSVIQNSNALAMKLFKSGEADTFIKKTLYPEKFERETFGDPIAFTDEPCAVCFGGKMELVEGKGARPCQHCRNERGHSTGLEPDKEIIQAIKE